MLFVTLNAFLYYIVGVKKVKIIGDKSFFMVYTIIG